ncbi:MAG: hypothetical protein C0483_11425 [Pirellula sp.]|nr:hypothetical protein [Pirellula sp.]
MLPALRNGSESEVAMRHPVNRLFERFFDDAMPSAVNRSQWAGLPISAWQDEDNIYVEADMPGMTAEDIDVAVHQGTLVISGERKCERQGVGYDSRCYGRMEQHVSLPAEVAGDKIEATLAHGVLSVKLPKAEAAKPRKIVVQAN